MAMLIDRRYNPFRDFEDIDRSFFGDNSLAEFKTDIRDIGDAYVMECDLPGFRKEDIALNLHDKVLTIKAERHSDFENAEKKGNTEIAKAYLEHLYSPAGQEIAAKNFYRPRDAAIAAKYAQQFPKLELVTIDKDFGGWKTAQPKFFNDGGVFDQIYQAQ